MIERHVYLPARTRQPGNMPEPHSLGDGQVALNLVDRRVFVGVPDEVDPSGMVEVTTLEQLFEHWRGTIERYAVRSHPDMQQPP